MAITKRVGQVWDKDLQRYVGGSTEVSFVGRVLDVYQRDYRAMSDVYTLATFAKVVTEDGKITEIMVNANFECDVEGGTADVDAGPEALAIKAEHDRRVEELAAERRRLQVEKANEAEKNRPVVGKRMVVVKGKKTPVGLQGTVAYVSGSNSVLLKADHEWKDRKAQGTWVPSYNLKAV